MTDRVLQFIGADQSGVWLIVAFLIGMIFAIALVALGPGAARRARGFTIGPMRPTGAGLTPPDGERTATLTNQDPLRLRDLGNDFFSRIVAQTTTDGLVVQRLNGIVLWVNDAYCEMMGLPRRKIIGRNPLEFCTPNHLRPSPEEIAEFRYDPDDHGDGLLHLHHNQRSDGTIFWNQISLTFRATPDGRRLAILVCRDATEQVQRQSEVEEARANLEFLAAHDSLTGLPNRSTFMTFAEHAIAHARISEAGFGIIRVDLDRFKLINDTHGHAAGDAVLVEVSHRMAAATRSGDMAARVGGDEFVVACPGVHSLADLNRICVHLSDALNGTFRWGDRDIYIGASVGAALSDADSSTPDDLLHRSDFALYAVKEKERGAVAMYDEALHQRFLDEKLMGDALVHAVATGRLEYHFHPVVDLTAQQTVSCETLARWHDPDLGTVPPAVFLPLAGRLGLMAEIDLAAMQAAIDAKVAFNAIGRDRVRVGFNASPELMTRADFVPRLRTAVTAAGLTSNDILVEVVENLVINRGKGLDRDVFDDLKTAGFDTLLDDFGTGHAGLASLSRLDVSGIKIDREMIRDLTTKINTRKIVETIVDLCASLDKLLIIEGVETEAQLAVLVEIGATVVQGHLFAEAMPLGAFKSWLQTGDGPDNNAMIARYGRDALAPDHSSPAPPPAVELSALRPTG